MKVHHLNCGTMNTLAGQHVCHVLLVETPGFDTPAESPISPATCGNDTPSR